MRPSSIRTDSSNAFANHTMRVRVPVILRETLHLNPDYPPEIRNRLETLAQEIQSGAPLPRIDPARPAGEDWIGELDKRQGETWHNTDWFFAETYMYRVMMDVTDWWNNTRDPFAPKKAEELQSEALWRTLDEALQISNDTTITIEEKLKALLQYDLWGNRIDLSYALAASHGAAWTEDDLLVDDSEAVIQTLLKAKQVDFVLDNAGTELAMDLVLADALLQMGVVHVVFHAKYHPTFVSDTLPADIMHFLSLLEADEQPERAGLGKRLRTAMDEKRLSLKWDLFWNSPFFLWELSPDNHVYQQLAQTDLVIVKGDANYRRIVGDAVWDTTTPFAEVLGYFPSPLVALRTLKSDPIVGLADGVAEGLDNADPMWRVNGRRGVIQFKRDKGLT
jgi:uncharacterized protein with ATP-grasp and redox domains